MVDNQQVRLNLAAVALCGLAALLAVHASEGTFAASPGFSGRGGQTCVACHHPASPTNDDAKAFLAGLPAAWSLRANYTLTIRVTGGPPAMPAPQPQGGFDLAADGGTLSIFPADDAKLRTFGPLEVSYRPAGTMQREWRVQWTAPGLAQRPAPATFWLAVLAANGNHVVATNTTDQGETLDSADHLRITIQPEPAAVDAWRVLPLVPPTVSLRQDGGLVLVEGVHHDGNATRVAWRADGGAWSQRLTGPQWTLRFAGLSAGAHHIDFRSEGDERSSPDQALDLRIEGGQASIVTPLAHGSAAPSASLLLILLPLAAFIRRPA